MEKILIKLKFNVKSSPTNQDICAKPESIIINVPDANPLKPSIILMELETPPIENPEKRIDIR